MKNKVFQKEINLQPEFLNINISEGNVNDILLDLEDSIEENRTKNVINENNGKINEKYFHNLNYKFFINETNFLFNEIKSVLFYKKEMH